MSMEIHDILRAADVKRWHIVRTHKPQSVAEHTFNVCMIARAIAKLAGVPDENIIKAALAHDLDEVLLGDIPTVIKERVRDGGVDINALYKRVTGRTLSVVDEIILKASDRLEAYWWISENGNGSHADLVRRDCAARYEQVFRWDLDENLMKAIREIEELLFHAEYTL